MQFSLASHRLSSLKWIVLVAGLAAATLVSRANAEATLLIDADSGKVLQAENATYPWYPASLTKLMTLYVTLEAVKSGRVNFDTLLTVSPMAASQPPSKMGLRAGTQVTLENALTMMMVKSANDIAVVIAEGVGGSIDGFAGMMNDQAAKLGMTQTHYVNPNGLPAEGHQTSARDLAILARSIIKNLPEYEYLVHIPAMKYGRRITLNFNKLIGRYPGADGMKTGFICAGGYNLVATATRDHKRLIAVVLGASSGQARALKAVQMLERGFGNNSLGWLQPSQGTVDNLVPIDAAPPDLHDEMCGPKRKRPASDADDDVAANESPSLSFFAAGLQAPVLRPADMLAGAAAAAEPVIVYTGPKKTGADLIAVNAVEEARQTPKPKGKKRVAAKKPDAGAAKPPVATAEAKPAAAKPATKPVVAAAKPAAAAPVKRVAAKPKAVAKPSPKATTGEAKPTTAAAPRT